MKTFLCSLLLLVSLATFAAVPEFRRQLFSTNANPANAVNANQFSVNGDKVSIKEFALLTNEISRGTLTADVINSGNIWAYDTNGQGHRFFAPWRAGGGLDDLITVQNQQTNGHTTINFLNMTNQQALTFGFADPRVNTLAFPNWNHMVTSIGKGEASNDVDSLGFQFAADNHFNGYRRFPTFVIKRGGGYHFHRQVTGLGAGAVGGDDLLSQPTSLVIANNALSNSLSSTGSHFGGSMTIEGPHRINGVSGQTYTDWNDGTDAWQLNVGTDFDRRWLFYHRVSSGGGGAFPMWIHGAAPHEAFVIGKEGITNGIYAKFLAGAFDPNGNPYTTNSGDGFPLTHTVSAADFSITNIHTLTLGPSQNPNMTSNAWIYAQSTNGQTRIIQLLSYNGPDQDLTQLSQYLLQLNATNGATNVMQLSSGVGVNSSITELLTASLYRWELIQGANDQKKFTMEVDSTPYFAWMTNQVVFTNGNVGIGTATPATPLDFAAVFGDKIRLYSGFDYGFGVQANVFQTYVPNSTTRWSVGYGNSASFTPVLSSINNLVGIGTATPTNRLDVNGSALIHTNLSILRGATYYRSNTITAASVVAGMANGDGAIVMISNSLQSVVMSNDVPNWVKLNTP